MSTFGNIVGLTLGVILFDSATVAQSLVPERCYYSAGAAWYERNEWELNILGDSRGEGLTLGEQGSGLTYFQRYGATVHVDWRQQADSMGATGFTLANTQGYVSNDLWFIQAFVSGFIEFSAAMTTTASFVSQFQFLAGDFDEVRFRVRLLEDLTTVFDLQGPGVIGNSIVFQLVPDRVYRLYFDLEVVAIGATFQAVGSAVVSIVPAPASAITIGGLVLFARPRRQPWRLAAAVRS